MSGSVGASEQSAPSLEKGVMDVEVMNSAVADNLEQLETVLKAHKSRGGKTIKGKSTEKGTDRQRLT